MKDAIKETDTLAMDLYIAHLISEQTLVEANNSEKSSREVRNHYILEELMTKVAKNPTNLMKIISVLQSHSSLVTIAKTMKRKCGNYKLYEPTCCTIFNKIPPFNNLYLKDKHSFKRDLLPQIKLHSKL